MYMVVLKLPGNLLYIHMYIGELHIRYVVYQQPNIYQVIEDYNNHNSEAVIYVDTYIAQIE